ncbi:MAG: hypothetical protein H0W44_02600 [Gammaproteobacteria bacterium]|nr:hypothetical protein [Gammaproteobacteria bacterium]
MPSEVKRLQVFPYDTQGQPLATQEYPAPSWDDIVKAIQELDGFQNPMLRLRLNDDEDPDGLDMESLGILGSPKAYAIFGYSLLEQEATYYAPKQGVDSVVVCSSDQGYSAPANEVCFEIDMVLKIAKHYYSNGDFFPGAGWKLIEDETE